MMSGADRTTQVKDLVLYYPEHAATKQLEHYCEIIYRLFDASFVLLQWNVQGINHICYSADAKRSYIEWCLQQDTPHLLSTLPFYLPNYHVVLMPVGEHGCLSMVREGTARLSTEQHEALTWLASSITDYLSDQSFIQFKDILVVRCDELKQQSSLEQVIFRQNAGESQFLACTSDTMLSFVQQHALKVACDVWRDQSIDSPLHHVVHIRAMTANGQLYKLSSRTLGNNELLISLVDLTPVTQLKEQQRRQAFLRGLFDCGLAAMVGLNQLQQVVYTNQLARESLWLPLEHKQQGHAVSTSFLRFFSLASEDETAISPFEFVDPDTGCRQGCHVRIQYPDGQSRIFAFWWVNRHDINEPEVAWYVLFFDVTEQYQLQQALGEMQHHVESLLNFSPVVVYQAFRDITQGFIYVSPNVETLLGYSQLQLMQQQQLFSDQIHHDDRVLLASDQHEMEYRLWSQREQKYIWLKDIRNIDGGNPTVVFGALTNITARKEAEAQQQRLQRELAGQKQILSLTLDALVDGVITIDQDGIIMSCNPAIYRMFGYQPTELIGKNVGILMPPNESAAHGQHVKRYLLTHESHVIGRGRDVQGLTKQGVEFPLHISVTELPGEQQQKFFVGCMHDLTETRKQQQQLLQASKLSALGTLTSGIAHDFNNILGIMRGYAEMLSGQTDPQVKYYAQNIIKAADRGSSLTRSLLDFSSNRARELQLGDLNAIIEDLRQLLLEACGKYVELVVDLSKERLPVELEKGGIENALLNMAINARHAMNNHGQLTIRTKLCTRSDAELQSYELPLTRYLEVVVSDTGAGMTDEVRQRVFEPFFTTKGTDGNGLGLAQVFGFIRRSHGHIVVKSEVGVGTEFSMIIPLSQKQLLVSSPPKATTTPSQVTTNQGEHAVLVVDDEPELLDVHVTMLQAAGFMVYAANNGEEALQALSQYQIDVLVSDIVMPGMDGLALAKEAIRLKPTLKIQMVSGFANSELATDEFTNQLFTDRLTKPVSARNLVNRVRLLLC